VIGKNRFSPYYLSLITYNLSHKDSHKKEKPEQNHQKQRNNRDEQTAQICPRFLIPGVWFGTMRAFAFACQKRALASLANLDFHAVRISKNRGQV
jgi:hypothetical protein